MAISVHTVKEHRGSGVTAPFILDVNTRWSSMALHASYTRPTESQDRTGRFGGEENLIHLTGIKPWIIWTIAKSLKQRSCLASKYLYKPKLNLSTPKP